MGSSREIEEISRVLRSKIAILVFYTLIRIRREPRKVLISRSRGKLRA